MKTKRTLQAKIVRHSEGLGVPTPDLVRQRADEIAKIDGRSVSNEQDWQQAKIELHGGNFAGALDDEDEMAQSVSERDMIAGSLGHHTENQGMEDDTNVGEELVCEGMEEAVHDRMLEASKLEETPGEA